MINMALKIQICLILLVWLSNWITNAARSTQCRIPRGDQYKRSIYRPQNDSTIKYNEGQFVRHLTKVRVVCRKDIYHDSITDWTYSKCNSGNWTPVLPSCIELKRCRAPPSIPHATASEPINQYITFAHGTFVTYTCDEGRVATGIGKTECQDGVWKAMDFECQVQVPLTTERPRGQNDQPRASTVLASEQNGNHRCIIPVLQGSVLRVKQTEEIPSTYVDHWTQLVQTCVAEGTIRTVKCVNGRWRPGFMTCGTPQGRRTNTQCVIPYWKHEETTTTFLKAANTSLQPGESVTHGNIIKLWCPSTSGSNNSSSDKYKAKFFQCQNGNWKPELQPCLPAVTSDVAEYKVNENAPPSALLSKQNTEPVMNDFGIPYDDSELPNYVNELPTDKDDGIPFYTYNELPNDTFGGIPFYTYNELPIDTDDGIPLDTYDVLPNTTDENIPFYTDKVTNAEETNVTAAPTSYKDDYTPGIKEEEDRTESKDTQSRDINRNSETRGKYIITRGGNSRTSNRDRDSNTRDMDSYRRDRDSNTRYSDNNKRDWDSYPLERDSETRDQDSNPLERDSETRDQDSNPLKRDSETRDRNSNTRDTETEPRDRSEDADTNDTGSEDVRHDSDGSDDKAHSATHQRRNDPDSSDSSHSTSSEDSDSSDSD